MHQADMRVLWVCLYRSTRAADRYAIWGTISTFREMHLQGLPEAPAPIGPPYADGIGADRRRNGDHPTTRRTLRPVARKFSVLVPRGLQSTRGLQLLVDEFVAWSIVYRQSAIRSGRKTIHPVATVAWCEANHVSRRTPSQPAPKSNRDGENPRHDGGEHTYILCDEPMGRVAGR